MESCNVCLNKFKDYELQNPRWCCSVRLCKGCYGKTDSCPQCRNGSNIRKIDISRVVNVRDFRITFTMKMGEYRVRSTCSMDGDARSIEYLENDNDKYYNRGNEPNLIEYNSFNCDHKWLNSDGHPHRDDGPAVITFNKNSKIIGELYRTDGKPQHRGALPNEIYYLRTDNGDIEGYMHSWYDSEGSLYREGDGPVIVYFRPNGTVISESYGHDRDFNSDDADGLPVEFEYYENGNPKCKCYVGKRIHYYEDGKEKHIEIYDSAHNCAKHTLFNLDGSIFAKFDVDYGNCNLQYME